MKAPKTGQELRHNAKERMKQYRKQMTEKGFISTTIFLSNEHRAELKRLGDEEGLSRADAAEYIFNIYLKSDDKTTTNTPDTSQSSEMTAVIHSLEKKIQALEARDSKRDKEFSEILSKMNVIFERQAKPTIKQKQAELFDLEPTPKPFATNGQCEIILHCTPCSTYGTDQDKPEAGETPNIADAPTLEFEPDESHQDDIPVLETENSKPKKPYPNSQPLLFEDEEPSKININAGTLFENPPSINDPEAYRKWIDEVLLELSGDRLSNKEICTELMERGIKTPKGKEKWYPVGVHAMLNHLRLQQEETGTTEEPKKSFIPSWQDEGYREYVREAIFRLKAHGLNSSEIVDSLEKLKIKTITGKKRWSIGMVNKMLNEFGDLDKVLDRIQSEQEDAGAIDKPERQADEPKVGSPEYGDWLFEKITELRTEGMPYGKIERYFNDKGILTVTGKKWGRNSVYAFFKKRSG